MCEHLEQDAKDYRARIDAGICPMPLCNAEPLSWNVCGDYSDWFCQCCGGEYVRAEFDQA